MSRVETVQMLELLRHESDIANMYTTIRELEQVLVPVLC